MEIYVRIGLDTDNYAHRIYYIINLRAYEFSGLSDPTVWMIYFFNADVFQTPTFTSQIITYFLLNDKLPIFFRINFLNT